MDLSIRPARADDAQMLSTLALQVNADEIIRHTVLVAEVADALAGCAMLVDEGSAWRLTHLWVRPSQQRSGVGKALVMAVTKLIRARRPGVLRIPHEAASQDFFFKLGAQKVESGLELAVTA